MSSGRIGNKPEVCVFTWSGEEQRILPSGGGWVFLGKHKLHGRNYKRTWTVETWIRWPESRRDPEQELRKTATRWLRHDKDVPSYEVELDNAFCAWLNTCKESMLLISGDNGATWNEFTEIELASRLGTSNVEWLKEQLEEEAE